MRIALTLLLFSFGLLNAYSQQEKNKKITGHVFELLPNDSLSPLVGVNVYYLNDNQGTSTNENGYFELAKEKAKDRIIFSFIGYNPDTLDLNKQKEINVVMKEGRLLDDMIVEFKKGAYTFSKIDPRNAIIIGQDELRKAACCNLAESFETNPSVDATFTDAVTGTKQIKMMGLSGKYVQMLSGNIPVIRGTSTLLGLELIPGAFIHQMAVSKGAGSVLNGFESMIGQINLNLKQPENAEKFHFNSYINQGGRTEQNLFFSKQVSKKWATTFLAHINNQTKENDQNKDEFLDNPLLQHYIFSNQWNYRSRKIHMELGANGVLANSQSGRIKQIPRYLVDIETNQANAFAKIGYLFPNDDFKSLALQLSTTYNNQSTSIGETKYTGNQYSGYANLIYQQQIGKKAKENYFKIGSSFQIDSVSENTQSNFIATNNNLFLEAVSGVFGEFTHNTEKWGLIAGLRADYTSYYDNYFVTPRLHIRHNFNNNNAIKLMAGSGRRTPFMFMENIGYMATSRNWILDNNISSMSGLLKDIDQEYSWNVGLAILKEFSLFYRDGTITLDAYHTMFMNQLVVDLDQSATELHFYSLDGQSFSNSIQAEINYDLNRRIKIRAAYRYLDVKTDYIDDLVERPFISKHRGFINLDYSTRKNNGKQWKVDITAQWIGSQRLPNTKESPEEYKLEARSPDFFLLNGQITRIASKSTEVYLGVENALNFRQSNPILSADNPQGEYFDSSIIWGPIFGRMVYFGVRFTLNENKE